MKLNQIELQKQLLNGTVTIDNKTYPISSLNGRGTVHTTINAEVGSHEFGNWNRRKYAALMPFDAIYSKQKDKIIGFDTVDTYFMNTLNLANGGYILCPCEEIEEVKRKNPNVTIIGYEGNNVTGFGDLLIKLLGYELEKCSKHSWINTYDNQEFSKIGSRYNLHPAEHNGSIYRTMGRCNTDV